MLSIFPEIIHAYGYEVLYQKKRFRVSDTEGFEYLKCLEKIRVYLCEGQIGFYTKRFCFGGNFTVFLRETFLYRSFECFKVVRENCESCSLTMSTKCDKIFTTLFQ